jgi:hypothetical protein
MSQIIKAVTAGSLPPSVPTSFVTDFGTAVPAANILNVTTNQSLINDPTGIESTGSGNTVQILLTNRASATTTTTDATVTTIITFPLSNILPGVYTIRGDVAGFIPAQNAGGSYDYVASVRTNGVTAVIIGSNFDTQLEDVVMEPSDIHVAVSGNNFLLQVQGIVATTIDWAATLNYLVVN